MASCLFSWGVALRPLLEILVALAAPAVLLCCADADSLAAEPEAVEPAELLLVAEEPEELLVAEPEELLVAELEELLVAEPELLLLVAELLLRLLSCEALEELRDALLELLVAELLLRLLSCDALEELLVAELELELLVDEPLLLRVWADTAEAETSDKASAAAAAASVNLLITFIDKCNTFWKFP